MASRGLGIGAGTGHEPPAPPVAVLAMGATAALLLVAVPMMGKNAAFMSAGSALFAIGLWVSGNPRLLMLWGLVFTAPLSLAKKFVPIPHMGGAGAFQLDISDIFLVALLAFQLRDRFRKFLPVLRLPPTLWWWALLILVGMQSLIMGPMRMLAAQQMFEMFKEGLLFFVVVNEVVRVKGIIQLVTALAMLVILLGVIAGAEFLRHGPLGLEFLGEATKQDAEYTNLATYLERGGGGTYRTGSLLGHPNLLAAFLAMTLPILVGALLSSIDWQRRFLFAAAILIGGVSLLLTLSRTGWISTGLAFTLMLVLASLHPRVRGRHVRLRLTMSIGLGAGIVAALPMIIKRFTQSDPGALNFRYEWMGVAWDFIQRDPLFGIGLNSFIFHLPGNTKYGDIAGLNQHFGTIWPIVHNIYLIVWSEQGTIGFIMFAGMYLSLVYCGLRNLLNPVDERLFMIGAGCLAGIGSTMIDGLSSFFLRNNQCARSFWIVAGLLVAIRYWNRANGPARAAARGLLPPLGSR